MSDWWVHRFYHADPIFLFAWIAWVIASIVLHELGHGIVAERQGDPTPRALGKMTLNPAEHIPPMAWVLFAFLGFTWGVMPIDPRNFRHGRWSRALVAAAGPAVNLVLAMTLLLALTLWLKYASASPAIFSGVTTVLVVGAKVNLVLLLFNLMPFPPLDGSAILAAAVPPIDRWFRDPRVLNAGFAIIMILGLLGMFGFIQTAAQFIEVNTVRALAGLLP
jgi:Zn-dependent protease